MRRFAIAILIIVVLLAAAWSGGWYALAGWADRNASAVLTELEQRGIVVDCQERDFVGFPFALKVSCGPTEITEQDSGAQAELAGLTGGASVFAPRTAEFELASPAELALPLLQAPAEFQWNDAELNVGLGMNGPQDVAFSAAALAADIPVPEMPGAAFTAERASGTLTPAPDGGTDVALAFSGLSLQGNGTAIPPFDGTISARLSAPPRSLLAGRVGLSAPLSAENIDVNIVVDEARLQAQGALAVDAEGVLDGTLTLRMTGSEALSAFVAALPAERQRLANAAIGGMLAFGQPTTLDGEQATELVVEIEEGEAQVGVLPPVRLPRLPI